MESYTNTDMAVVDSCAQSYDIKIGDKKIFDDAYAKWAKKNGIQAGWNNQQHNYKSESTLENEGRESAKQNKADRQELVKLSKAASKAASKAKAEINRVNKAKKKIRDAKKRDIKPKSEKAS